MQYIMPHNSTYECIDLRVWEVVVEKVSDDASYTMPLLWCSDTVMRKSVQQIKESRTLMRNSSSLMMTPHTSSFSPSSCATPASCCCSC